MTDETVEKLTAFRREATEALPIIPSPVLDLIIQYAVPIDLSFILGYMYPSDLGSVGSGHVDRDFHWGTFDPMVEIGVCHIGRCLASYISNERPHGKSQAANFVMAMYKDQDADPPLESVLALLEILMLYGLHSSTVFCLGRMYLPRSARLSPTNDSTSISETWKGIDWVVERDEVSFIRDEVNLKCAHQYLWKPKKNQDIPLGRDKTLTVHHLNSLPIFKDQPSLLSSKTTKLMPATPEMVFEMLDRHTGNRRLKAWKLLGFLLCPERLIDHTTLVEPILHDIYSRMHQALWWTVDGYLEALPELDCCGWHNSPTWNAFLVLTPDPHALRLITW